MAWVSFVAFITAGVWSLLYLAGGRRPRHDLAAAAAVELGMVFCVLATVTGAIWARIEWGAFWNWDPRQTSIVLALVFYAAYLALRGAVEDDQARARLAAAYAVLGLVVAPFLYFVLPRVQLLAPPGAGGQPAGAGGHGVAMLQVLLAASLGFTALFFWLHNLRCAAAAGGGRRRRRNERGGEALSCDREPGTTTHRGALMGEGLGWVLVVNLVIWTGLFLYMLRLGRRVRAAERAAFEGAAAQADGRTTSGRER